MLKKKLIMRKTALTVMLTLMFTVGLTGYVSSKAEVIGGVAMDAGNVATEGKDLVKEKEAEAKRLTEEAEAKRIVEEEAAKRLAEEKEAKKKAQEEEARKKAEAKAEAKNKAEIEAKKKADAEAKKKTAEKETSVAKEPTLTERIAATNTAKKTNQIVLVIQNKLYLMNKNGDGTWSSSFNTQSWHGSRGYSSNRTEGDKTTPTGSFPLLYAFGQGGNPGTKMDYRQITPTSYWGGSHIDPTYYNLWYEGTDPVHTDNSEKLIEYQKAYKYALVIGFNMNRVVGKGSAIFLHVDSGSKSTEGCVSIPEPAMLHIMKTVKPGAYIIITTKEDNLKHY